MVIRIHPEKLRTFAREVLVKVGMPGDYAEIVADHLVLANLRGVDSHGIIRLPLYVNGILQGEINPRPAIKVIKEKGSCALIDGDRGLGIIAVSKATELAIKKAREYGASIVGARNIWHSGMLAYYVLKIVENGMVGFVCANAAPRMAPLGCKRAILGTNPLAIGFPVKGKPPIILDMATSAVAYGKILVAARKGEKIPEGWAMNKEGFVTTDPKEALQGILLPFGGYKGFGIALAIDVICGIVLGGGYGLKLVNRLYSQGGVFVGAVDINSFRSYEEYLSEMAEYVDVIKSTPTAPGFEVLLPGEPEHREYVDRIEKGIPLDDETLNELMKLSEKYGVKLLID